MHFIYRAALVLLNINSKKISVTCSVPNLRVHTIIAGCAIPRFILKTMPLHFLKPISQKVYRNNRVRSRFSNFKTSINEQGNTSVRIVYHIR